MPSKTGFQKCLIQWRCHKPWVSHSELWWWFIDFPSLSIQFLINNLKKTLLTVISTSPLDKQGKKAKRTGWEGSAPGICQERQRWAQTGYWKSSLWTSGPRKSHCLSSYHLYLLFSKGPRFKSRGRFFDLFLLNSAVFATIRTSSVCIWNSYKKQKKPTPNPDNPILRSKTHFYPSIELLYFPTNLNRGLVTTEVFFTTANSLYKRKSV